MDTTDSYARGLADRLKKAADPQGNEEYTNRSKAVKARQLRVVSELATILVELDGRPHPQRARIESEMDRELGLMGEFGVLTDLDIPTGFDRVNGRVIIRKGASTKALAASGVRWSRLFASLGIK